MVPMALTARQRSKLPDSAFAYPSRRSFPVPTKAQARAAGIGETQRLNTLRNALSRAAQDHTHGTTAHVRAAVARRAGGKIASVAATHKPSGRRRR